MGKRTIIINGLPRPNGNTAYLIDVLRGPLEGEIIEISAFRSGIAPLRGLPRLLGDGEVRGTGRDAGHLRR